MNRSLEGFDRRKDVEPLLEVHRPQRRRGPPDAGLNFVSALEDFGDEVDGRFWATPTLQLFEPLEVPFF
jgi:hypothetical protein